MTDLSLSPQPIEPTKPDTDAVSQNENVLADSQVEMTVKPINQMRANFFRRRAKMFVGLFFFVLLLVGGVVAYGLTQTSQDLRQQASGHNVYAGTCKTDSNCPAGMFCLRGTRRVPLGNCVTKCTNSSQCQRGEYCENSRCFACRTEGMQAFESAQCCQGMVAKPVECTALKKLLNQCPPAVEGGYKECQKI